jgi:hypothetical protein
MNNTHYALLNEDNYVVAVVIKDNFEPRVIKAIEDETGDQVLSIKFDEVDHENYNVIANMFGGGIKYVATLVPTWEY